MQFSQQDSTTLGADSRSPRLFSSKSLILAIALLVTGTVYAAWVPTMGYKTVTGIGVYTGQNGLTDAYITLAETDIVNCAGGAWLSGGDPGFERAYAALLAAYASGASMRVNVNKGDHWPGSSTQYCRVISVEVN